MIVTIDGPAGSGKSTAARNLAQQLSLEFLDTGATYRAATLKALQELGDLSKADDNQLARAAKDAQIQLLSRDGDLRVLLDGRDVSAEIRSTRVTENAHHLAKCPGVREVLVELQRDIGRRLGDFVTEGRDQGTVVFPQAQKKIYLDARPEVRAKRRLAELRTRGEQADYQQVLDAILRRDQRDASRSVGPLARPEDAVVLDTSDLDPGQTLDALIAIVRERP
jgi:cytidylate kinase